MPSLSWLRAVSISIMVIYIAVLIDIYNRYNGIDFWVMIMVFVPLHLLFTFAPSQYSKLKWFFSAVALVLLSLLVLTEIHPPMVPYFYTVAFAYMLNMLALMVLAGFSLMHSQN